MYIAYVQSPISQKHEIKPPRKINILKQNKEKCLAVPTNEQLLRKKKACSKFQINQKL